jgi:hypothetical protein
MQSRNSLNNGIRSYPKLITQEKSLSQPEITEINTETLASQVAVETI